MTRIAPVLALAALLLVAAPAAGKGVTDPRVCGADGCVPVPLDANTFLVFEGAPLARGPAAAEPYLELRYGMAHGVAGTEPTVTNRFLPEAGLIRAETGGWRRPPEEGLATVRRIAADLERFGEPRRAPAAPGGPSPLLLAGLCALAAAAAAAGVGRHRRAAARG